METFDCGPDLGDITMSLPPSWHRRSHSAHGVLVTARSPVLPASGVQPELTLRYCPVAEDLPGWRARAMSELRTALTDFDLEDDDDFELMGHPVAYRRFAHREGGADVLCDQWAWLRGELGVTLTCSLARVDYADYCDLFEAVAETVELSRRAADETIAY